MKYYLSSFKFGNEVEKLKQMLPQGAKIGHINNSKDWTTASPVKRAKYLKEEMEFLDNLGFHNEHLDLKNYFGKENELREKLANLDGIWVAGGHTFILRQAMMLSGFDNIYFDTLKNRKDFFWGGYSAGICILCDSLKYIQNVDMPNDFPYEGNKENIWEGLGLFNYGILPHYDSDHHESEEIGKEVQRCIENRWLFKVMRDGEVIIIED
jgi:dipeptidase E